MSPVDVAAEIAAAVGILSRHRLGAIILLEPAATVDGGVLIDGVVGRELLISLAVPEHVNRLHRGAIVIRGDRVDRAGVPFTWADVVDGAAALAAGVAIAVDADTGEIRIAGPTGTVTVIEDDALLEVLRLHASAGADSVADER